MLVTNLHNLVQPIIRLAVADVMTMHPEPCACGRSLVRAAAIDGRHDDVLSLPARGGGTVTVLPAQFSVITRDRAVREFQVRQEPGGVRVLVVPCADGDPELEARLRDAVAQALGGSARTRASRSSACGALARRGGKLADRPGGCRAKLAGVKVEAPAGAGRARRRRACRLEAGSYASTARWSRSSTPSSRSRHGLPFTSYEVLRSLRCSPVGKLRMAELAEHVLLSRSGMTRLIDRLEREGFVTRSTCDKDGRGCYAVLTAEGAAAVDQARATHLAVVRARFLALLARGARRARRALSQAAVENLIGLD